MSTLRPVAFSHIIIIYNPASTGPSQAMAEALAARLSGGPAVVELAPTRHAGHGEELAAAAARRYPRPLVVSSSGDGGYHEVVNGVMAAVAAGHQAAAAVLPAGNANDHHRTLARAPLADGIAAGRTARIDLLRVEIQPPTGGGPSAAHPSAAPPPTIRYAHSYLGLGLTPVVAAELNRHTLNVVRELIIVVRAFARLRPVAIRVGGRAVELDSLIISNIRHMAKTLTLSRTGHPADGQFEITTFPAAGKLRLLGRLAHAAVIGLRANARAKHYAFETLKPTPIQLDGEVTNLTAGTRVTITIAPAALETIL
jgi:diacylglycerol kinase (ATP)